MTRHLAFGLLFVALSTLTYAESNDTSYTNRGSLPSVPFEVRVVGDKHDQNLETRLDLNGDKILVSKDSPITNADVKLTAVMENFDDIDGASWLAIRLNRHGREKLERLTTDNISKRLAILVNQTIVSSPVVEVPVPNGVILFPTGKSKTEAEQLARGIVGNAR